MPANKNQGVIVVFDLDGVMVSGDLAISLFRNHGLAGFFKQTSSEIITAIKQGKSFDGKPAYPAQTLEYVLREAVKAGERITVQEIQALARKERLMPGAKELIQKLKSNPNVKDVYVVSSAYEPAAEVIAERLGIPAKNVVATQLRYREDGVVYGTMGSARGGIHKARAIQLISANSRTPIRKMIAIGDTLTDGAMLKEIAEKGGLGIAFNAHEDLIRENPSVVFAGKSIKPVAGIVEKFASQGHMGVRRIIQRNRRLHRYAMPVMHAFRRPQLFTGDLSTRANAVRVSARHRK
ncbi:MAG: HAD-IB family phosphatase [Candidatus Diapherotrites archaeon]|nr:HAD-IB family phosphatase [Candidatus Diapherotrites archaeon]